MSVLLWKPFAPDAVPPRWIREKKKPELTPGKVTVSAFVNGWCPGMNTGLRTGQKSRRGNRG